MHVFDIQEEEKRQKETQSHNPYPVLSVSVYTVQTYGSSSKVVMFLAIFIAIVSCPAADSASWCIVRSNSSASDQSLQIALDYACGAGADCASIQPNDLCYLPNTLAAHASYAFNSYYQRKAMAPGTCDFSGTAIVAMTDPSYGSCAYPSSVSNAGGNLPPTTPTNPIIAFPQPPPPPGFTGITEINPSLGPSEPSMDSSPLFSPHVYFLPFFFVVLHFLFDPV